MRNIRATLKTWKFWPKRAPTKSDKQLYKEALFSDRPKTFVARGPNMQDYQQGVAHAFTDRSVPYTLRWTIQQETERARGVRQYNPDVQPYQPWLLRWTNTDPFTSWYRERLLKGSQLLRKHTYDMLWKIVAKSWKYDDGTKPEWGPDLEDAFIEATAKGMVVNTAGLTRWTDGTYRIFTTNDVIQPVYWNKGLKISEIYFNFPVFAGAVSEDGQAFNPMPVGFLTQHAADESRPSRVQGQGLGTQTEKGTIYRDCVLIQPMPSIHDIFGESWLQIECDTATQKTYLRGYEFAFLHKGGINKTIAINANVDDTMKDAVMKDAKRGLWSRGLALFMKANSKPVNDQVLSASEPIPNLNFEQLSSMISEDAQLTKQKIQGAAETGALGGQAPAINKETDDELEDSLLFLVEKIIRDIEWVFFNKEPYKDELDSNGRMRKVPAYRVIFPDPQEEAMEEKREQQLFDNELAIAQKTAGQPAQANAVAGEQVYAHSVSISDSYVTYKGNLFQAGAYHYPELGRYEIYTPQDIEHFTQNPINKAPLELSHSMNPVRAGLHNNLGYLETIGYDAEAKKDITLFHIKTAADKDLRSQGIIQNDQIKVSPYFHKRFNNQTNTKEIYNLNAAIIDPNKQRPRAELTGLDSSAKKV